MRPPPARSRGWILRQSRADSTRARAAWPQPRYPPPDTEENDRMSQLHHQGDPSASSQLSGVIAMILLAIVTFGMFISSVMYSGNAAQGSAGRPVPTMARR